MATIAAATKATSKAIKRTTFGNTLLNRRDGYDTLNNASDSWADVSVRENVRGHGHSNGMVPIGNFTGDVSKTIHNNHERSVELLPRSDFLPYFGGISTKQHLNVPSISGGTASQAANASARDAHLYPRTSAVAERNAVYGNPRDSSGIAGRTRNTGRNPHSGNAEKSNLGNVKLPGATADSNNKSASGNEGRSHNSSVPGLAAAAGVASATSGVFGIAQTKMRNDTAKQMQMSSQEYNTGLINQHKSALSEVGLPSYLAYGGSASSLPHTGQVTAGRSVYHSKLPGNSMSHPFMGNTAQTSMGWGSVI